VKPQYDEKGGLGFIYAEIILDWIFRGKIE
jgi:hypothetical protein